MEWWEGEGLEVLAFRIALPEPNIVKDITKDELVEIIVEKIEKDAFDEKGDLIESDDEFTNDFKIYLIDYYHELLKINFKMYKYEYFIIHKGKTYSVEEKIEKIWGNKQ